MKYQILLIPIWVIDCSHIEKNNSEVFITYGGHSDLERDANIDKGKTEDKEDKEVTTEAVTGVVFIPNDKPVLRNTNDVINSRRGDVVNDDVQVVTEKPNQDILFISGKNNENIEKSEISKKEKAHQDSKDDKKVVKKAKVDCNHLDCNNSVNAVCGGKEENKRWKNRLFLNECFFRKVNCGFQNAINSKDSKCFFFDDDDERPEIGYNVVPMEQCKNIGAHYISRPYVFKPIPIPAQNKAPVVDTRRSFSSRRSLNMGVDGTFCAHACPSSCTEDYDPQCAVSNSGVRKVFLNHCKLDYNSCLYKVVWHRRPLSECVGGRKADINQNRGFIGWMQRVGIVDRKGRLVLS